MSEPTASREPTAFRQIQFQRPPGASEPLLVRHGESAAAVEGVPFELVEGHGNPPLSNEGHAQADLVGARLATEPIAAAYVSNLQRTAQTAAPFVARSGLTPIVERDLREVYLGEWESGLFRQKVAERDPIAVRMSLEQRWDVIPGAEPAIDFANRARAVVERIASSHPDECVAVFAHGAIIGEMLSLATGGRGFAFMPDNASISQIVVTSERWIVRRFNDTAHLGVGLATSG
jgi:probable phosphoglycerate mutase